MSSFFLLIKENIPEIDQEISFHVSCRLSPRNAETHFLGKAFHLKSLLGDNLQEMPKPIF